MKQPIRLRGISGDARRVTLLRGVTRLSAQLGLRVVVEGVETEEQLELLAGEDSIDEVQGYLFCRPMPASQLRSLPLIERSSFEPEAIFVAHRTVAKPPALLRQDVGFDLRVNAIGLRA